MKALGSLLLIGLVIAYWWIALTLLLVYLIVKAAPVAYRELQDERNAERNRLRDIIARADTQHAWASQGDVRGVYGAYPPA